MGARAACWQMALAAAIFFLSAAAMGATDRRVALVIGNGAYKNSAALANPANDARDMAAALERVGFDVIFEHDLDKRAMERAMVRFARAAQNADAALFYYAGHGIQREGVNYLVPTDARLEDEFSLNFELTRVADVLSALERARGVKILILDACRNNPLARRLLPQTASREAGGWRGLARIDSIRGMVIAYAAQPNQVAVDGEGKHSPFTQALLKHIDEPGVEIGTLFRRVAADVNRATHGRQLPELSVSLFGEFYLNERASDVQAWAKVRDSAKPDDLRQFLHEYPKSVLASDARTRLAAIESERVLREQRERERLERDRQEQERLQSERLERARLERDRQEQGRLESERLKREHQERIAREAAAREKAQQEQEQRLHELAERERLAREKMIREISEHEKLQRERLAKEVAALAKARQEQERQLREQVESARAEREQLARQLAERERIEQERTAREAKDRAEREQAAAARAAASSSPAPGQAAGPVIALLTKPELPVPLAAAKPDDPATLSRDLQKELQRVGCYVGAIDGEWGPKSKAALRGFLRRTGQASASDEPAPEALRAVAAHSDRVCPRIASRSPPTDTPAPQRPRSGSAGAPVGDDAIRSRLNSLRSSCRGNDLAACQQMCSLGGKGACGKAKRLLSGGGGRYGRGRNGRYYRPTNP